MQIKKLLIENFRGIEKFEREFVDDFGNPAKVILIVGPNSSGKTSILDAIWFSLMSEMGYDLQRENFRPEAEFVVKTGENFARVQLHIHLNQDEIASVNQLKNQLVQLKEIPHIADLAQDEIIVDWTYPAKHHYQEARYGGYQFEPKNARLALHGQAYQKRYQQLSATNPTVLLGMIYLFEENRIVKGKPIKMNPTITEKTMDIRALLIDLGIKQMMSKQPIYDSLYNNIQTAFNQICAPCKMGRVYALESDGEYEIEFYAENNALFGFDGLSSGQREILNFLVQYIVKRMSNSIILLDEFEMHLSDVWQNRLFTYLRDNTDSNQFIITTHNPYLTQFLSDEQIVDLRKLDDIPSWQYEVVGTDE
ncbi:MAG: AAA family ATPase [bacterium]|nr:AAA family ATPase [bacterium]